ncbi:MAG TPA: SDR family oxidoreductase [Gemmatimonadales bacterium]|nr:SDR family oxidoreductase [Gemmatimonadales bacterium]
MDLGLQGKVALVTASSQGLGRAVALELATEGAPVVICARGVEALEEAKSQIAIRTKTPVHAVVADLAKDGEPVRVVAEAIKRFGQVDILVTNTGGPPSGPAEQHDPAAWQAATELLLRAPVELARAVLPGMRERQWGRIITITSIAVKQPVEGLILSNSLRAAVTGFARTLANETATDGITVNNVMPGFTRTDRVVDLARANAARTGVTDAEVFARWEREIPMGRLGEVKEFAALVAFLASERASYITGTSIPVDGGWIRALL